MRIVNTYTPHLPVYGAASRSGDACCDDIRLMIVLTQDENEKFAAYMGLADFSQSDHRRVASCIASGGHKMNYRMAKGFYPFLPEEQYRA